MAETPRWKVYVSGQYLASCKERDASIALAEWYGHRSEVRDRHADVVWQYGEPGVIRSDPRDVEPAQSTQDAPIVVEYVPSKMPGVQFELLGPEGIEEGRLVTAKVKGGGRSHQCVVGEQSGPGFESTYGPNRGRRICHYAILEELDA